MDHLGDFNGSCLQTETMKRLTQLLTEKRHALIASDYLLSCGDNESDTHCIEKLVQVHDSGSDAALDDMRLCYTDGKALCLPSPLHIPAFLPPNSPQPDPHHSVVHCLRNHFDDLSQQCRNSTIVRNLVENHPYGSQSNGIDDLQIIAVDFDDGRADLGSTLPDGHTLDADEAPQSTEQFDDVPNKIRG